MKKKLKLLTIFACVFAFCMTAFIAINVNSAKADGESYTLSFRTSNYDMASSAETWTRHKAPTIENGVATLTRSASDGTINYAAGVGKYNVEADKTYRIELRFKTNGRIRFVMSTEVPDYSAKIIPDDNYDYSDYTDISYDYVATKSGKLDFIFQLLGGEGNILVKDFYCYEKNGMTVTAGSAIGELPELPEKTGYDGYWTIDGEKITAETVYNYGADKVAVAKYAVVNKLTFLSDGYEYDMAANGSWADDITDGVATISRVAADGTKNYRPGAGKFKVVAGQKYRLHLSVKTDSEIRFVLSSEKPNWSMKFMPDSKVNNPDFVDYVIDYVPSASGDFQLIFQLIAGEGNIYIKNFRFCKLIERKFESETAIGELPEIPEITGYDSYWTIDGEKITAETVYNYGTDKTAVPVYEKNNKFNLSFCAKDYDMAASAESWNRYNVPTIENGVATLTRTDSDGTKNYAAGVGKYNVEAGKTYKLELKLKADNISIRFSTERPNYDAVFIDGRINNADYIAYSFDYTATTTGAVDFIFQLTAGTGNVCIKEFYFYEDITRVVEGGTAIGELPALANIPVKHGFEYCWTIDGAKITAETVFNYGVDKVAVPSMLEIAGDHTMTKVDAVDSTCTEDGVKEYYVCACGKNFTDENGYNEIEDLDAWKVADGKIAAKGHTATKVAGKAATCKEVGVKDHYNCSVCGKNFEEETCETEITDLEAWKNGNGKLDLVAHTATKVDSVAATCIANGVKAYYHCSVCEKNFEEETCTTEIADLDAWKKGDGKLDLVAHTATKVDSVAATCTANGVKEYYHCSVCNKNFKEETCTTEITDLDAWKNGDGKIAAKGHVAATEWDSDENGHWHNCETCGAKMNETAGEHTDGDDDGECDVCGYETGKEPVVSGNTEEPASGSESKSGGGCFSGINGVVGMTTLALLAASAVILAKRKEN